jgi:hypothetical protein
MDKKPFFTFDLLAFDDAHIEELALFQKSGFSIETILEAASNLKYQTAAALYLKRQLENPDEDFVKMVGRHIYGGMLTKAIVEQLRPSIKASLDEVIRDRIQDKLSVAFRPETSPVDTRKTETGDTSPSEIETTEEELQAFMIVRAIAARVIDINRITMRDAKSYCSIFVDDNNRKPVCRLYFNSKSVRHIGLFEAEKVEDRQQINSLTQIYDFSARIEEAVKAYV